VSPDPLYPPPPCAPATVRVYVCVCVCVRVCARAHVCACVCDRAFVCVLCTGAKSPSSIRGGPPHHAYLGEGYGRGVFGGCACV